jgi:hypothetical protein
MSDVLSSVVYGRRAAQQRLSLHHVNYQPPLRVSSLKSHRSHRCWPLNSSAYAFLTHYISKADTQKNNLTLRIVNRRWT